MHRAAVFVLVLAPLAACAPPTEPLNGRAIIHPSSAEEKELDAFYGTYKTGPWMCDDGRRIRYLASGSVTCAPDRP